MAAGASETSDPLRELAHDIVDRIGPREFMRATMPSVLDAALGSERPASRRRVAGQEAYYLIMAQRRCVREYLRRESGSWSAARWLYYLRLLPAEVFYSTTYADQFFKEELAEAITACSKAKDTASATVGALLYPFTEEAYQKVLRLCTGIELLAYLDTLSDNVQRGTTLIVDPRMPVPQDEPTMAQRRAITLYDQRIIADPWAYAGTFRAGTPVLAWNSADESDFRFLAVLRLARWTRTPMNVLAPRVAPAPETLGRFVLLSTALRSDFAGLASNGDLVPNRVRLAAVLHVLRCMGELVIKGVVDVTHIYRYGFVTLRLPSWERYLQKAWRRSKPALGDIVPGVDDIDSQAVIDETYRCDANDSPVIPGPVVRREGELGLVDIATASSLIKVLVSAHRDSTPRIQRRSKDFETAVQAAIDDSEWRPVAPLRELVGRELRIDGRPVTDIDAMAQRGHDLILIDCKSYPFTALYEAGAHAAVRKRVSDVESAVRAWKDKVKRIRTAKKGMNFDFTDYDIEGVVCTPFPVFVPIGIATREIRPGLRAACSLGELAQFVESKQWNL